MFQRALGVPAGERDAWLSDSCGEDEELLKEVRSLLDAHESSDQFLEQPIGAQFEDAEMSKWTGRLVGPWRIVEKLGEGGLGVVFRAKRDDGQYQKEAAVKVVRAGLDLDTIRIRFRKERQALASIDHPRVPKLLDGGIAGGGQPFLVMEYIGGKTLEEIIQSPGANREECVRFIEQIVDAARYLHAQLMVHADLKPSNILVTSEGEARLLDFGSTAWLTPDVESSGVTHLILTPAYASPEQKRGEPAKPSCDIFAIGRMLQRLLEQMPEPKDADLSAIAAKATQEHAADRYLTAQELLQDLERRRTHQPVIARHQTLGYRMSRFFRRRRFETIAAGLAIAGVLGGSAAAVAGYIRARKAEAVAVEEAASAREVSKFLVRLFETSDPDKSKGQQVTAKQLLEQGTRIVDSELRNEPHVQSNLMVTLGSVQNKIGDYGASARLLQQAIGKGFAPGPDGERRKAAAHFELGDTLLRQGKYPDARRSFEEAQAIYKRELGEESHEVARTYTMLGHVLSALNERDEALRVQRESLRILEKLLAAGSASVKPGDLAGARRNTAVALLKHGKNEEALALFEQALPEYEKAYENQSRLADLLDDIAMLHNQSGRLKEAAPLFERSMAIRKRIYAPDHPVQAFSLHNFGLLLMKIDRGQEGIRMMEEAIRIRVKALGPSHPYVSITRTDLGGALLSTGNPQAAVVPLEAAMQAFRATSHPRDSYFLLAQRTLGEALANSGRLNDAIPYLRDAATQSDNPKLRLNLDGKAFDKVRNQRAFVALVKETQQTAPVSNGPSK